jgi:hypothetical protein
MKINTYRVITSQSASKDWKEDKLILIRNIASYLIKPNESNFMYVLKPLGRLIKCFNLSVSVSSTMPLAVKKTDQDILFGVNELILQRAYKDSLIPLLINLVTHFKNTK